jgi:hypothetical protein
MSAEWVIVQDLLAKVVLHPPWGTTSAVPHGVPRLGLAAISYAASSPLSTKQNLSAATTPPTAPRRSGPASPMTPVKSEDHIDLDDEGFPLIFQMKRAAPSSAASSRQSSARTLLYSDDAKPPADPANDMDQAIDDDGFPIFEMGFVTPMKTGRPAPKAPKLDKASAVVDPKPIRRKVEPK